MSLLAAGSVPARVAALTEGVVKAMFVAKMKKVATVVMGVLILAAGAGAWRYAAGAGQAEEQREAKSLPPKAALPKGEGLREEAAIGPIPAAPRSFRIDLRITQEKDGHRKALADPQLIAPEGQEAYCGLGPGYVYSVGRKHLFRFNKGPSVQVKVCSDEKGGLCLDMTVNETAAVKSEGNRKVDVAVEGRSLRVLRWIKLGQPTTVKFRTGDKKQDVLEVTAAIHEIDQGAVKNMESRLFPAEDPSQSFAQFYGYSAPPAPGSAEWKQQEAKKEAKMLAAAEKDLKIAEFYRRNGHPDSARFYYELICRRYPGTNAAKRATQQLPEEKSPDRVGQIFIFGNTKTSDSIILEQVPLFPGQPFYDANIREAERNLSRLKCFKSNPKVEVLDREGDGVFRDIRISVEEK